jgi:glycosyltransferase involved in cell wall biosynthesis
VVLAFGTAGSPWLLPTYEPLRRDFNLCMLSANSSTRGDWVRHVATSRDYLRVMPGMLRTAAEQLTCRGWPDWERIAGLRRHVRDADLVHTVETFSGASLQAAGLKRRMGFRHVVTVWENIAHRLACHPRVAAVKRRVLASADHFIAVSERARTALLLEGAAESRISVVPPGLTIQCPAVRAAPKPGQFELLFVGKKQRSKGLADLLSALWLARRDERLQGIELTLTCLGVQPSQGPYADLISRYGLAPHIREWPLVPHDQVLEYYRRADALVVPSRVTPLWQEQWGMVFMEAMSQGLPVITSFSGSIPDVVHDAALFSRPNDHHSLYLAICQLASDPARWRGLSAAGAEIARRQYAADLVAERIGHVYDTVLGRDTISRPTHPMS